MIRGLDYFREYFKEFQDSYVLIGGVACYLSLDEAGLDFRATKDLDIVLCAEAMDVAFVSKFWDFVREGTYEHQEKSTGDKQFYRFNNPANKEFPFMLELFSRKPEQLKFEGEGHLIPIPMDEEVSSLSAILLNDDYYQCINEGKVIVDSISILGPSYILPFKARAWLDLTARKKAGERVDSKNIKKHLNDVFRIFPLLSPSQTINIAESIKSDLHQFIEAVEQEKGINMKNFNIKDLSLSDVLSNIRSIYKLE
ncbi:MAG: hypothetical protein GQ546_14090 [Gammaproteobacteria bacterium]|nr:hypothetical protein [Gammaproteobacteria bacterium]